MIVTALLTFATLCLIWCIQRELGEAITDLLWLHSPERQSGELWKLAWGMHETLDRMIILDNQRYFRLELGCPSS